MVAGGVRGACPSPRKARPYERERVSLEGEFGSKIQNSKRCAASAAQALPRAVRLCETSRWNAEGVPALSRFAITAFQRTCAFEKKRKEQGHFEAEMERKKCIRQRAMRRIRCANHRTPPLASTPRECDGYTPRHLHHDNHASYLVEKIEWGDGFRTLSRKNRSVLKIIAVCTEGGKMALTVETVRSLCTNGRVLTYVRRRHGGGRREGGGA